MKKLINHPEYVVQEMIEGMALAHPQIVKKLPDTHVLVRADLSKEKVALVSGGGSGHEPSHGGFVGTGMLDAAVAGEVFTSPTPDQLLAAIKAVDRGKGVLLVIKNYSGDVMNFEMAMELAEAEGIQVKKVIVDDDVAVKNSTYTVGRRGIAGTVFVHKIAGALAEQGASLDEVQKVAEKVISRVRSMGMALSPCTIPAVGKPGFEIGEDEMEMGMGIHGEPGIDRTKIASADEVASTLVSYILEDMPCREGERVAVMINGLGATPLMELYIVNRKVAKLLQEKQIQVHKTFVGEYMTSLEMAGCSVTLLKLDDQLTELLDAPAQTIAWS
ncbi:dihydroxyacetone kinase subunit DhaK [Thermoflavimicrobium dichotomicum]|uniref:phosphoenolpyruvate--glycerone phosphotransferase n=1 Tax=Thermoflavimicrobium dichotomicum TaxID=46223 RepID=A0A1I3P2B2_9BACL|nr:dihydroxyacetone kinase subunit DhaK [Thermoflavimicrobium dichotomicum]SFJ15477.1 dihydroxyacetone kinase, N-terminal domain [Thermoflavimicrobium dichotomicum]